MSPAPFVAARRWLKTYGKPAHLRVFGRDALGTRNRPGRAERNLEAAMHWLCRAQDVTGCGGVSAGYFFEDGWRKPYPETTGYIIPTFLRYAALKQDEDFARRAMRMGEWEAEIQLPDGAVRGGVGVNDYPIVFNTGQVILGWASLCRRLDGERFAASLARACDWLVSVQDEDGAFRRHTYGGIPHAYHTRVAWGLLEAFAILGNESWKTAAERQIHWALSHVRADGWIEHMGFDATSPPFTHTIAYTLRGLLESARHLDGELARQALDVVERAATRLMRRYELAKSNPYALPAFFTGRFDRGFRPAADFSCLTGNCQIALVWLKLYRRNDDARLLNAALKILDQVASTQSLGARHPGIRGGIAGSYPVWGAYIPNGYPNWAAKFFADALMLQESTMRRLEPPA